MLHLQLFRIDQGMSQPENSSPRSPVRLVVDDINTSARTEPYDCEHVVLLLDRLEKSQHERNAALKIVMHKISVLQDQYTTTAEGSEERRGYGDQMATHVMQRKTLLRTEDMLDTIGELHLIPDRDAAGRIVQQITYDQPRRIGRQVARQPHTCRTVQTRVLDDDPAANAEHLVQPGESTRPMLRTVCYQGMHEELLPVCGGKFLYNAHIDNCFSTIIVNEARRIGRLPVVPTIAEFKRNPDALLAAIVSEHDLETNQNRHDALAEALALVNSLICGASYTKWLKNRQVRQSLTLYMYWSRLSLPHPHFSNSHHQYMNVAHCRVRSSLSK